MILLTGSQGFLGNHLRQLLQKNNIKYRCLSIKNNLNCECFNYVNNIPNSEIFSEITTLIHMGSITSDIKDINYIYKFNVLGSVNLMKGCIKYGIKKFIYISSVKANGYNLDDNLIDENDYRMPTDSYGKSKNLAEEELTCLAKSEGISLVILRPTVIYGSGMTSKLHIYIKLLNSRFFPQITFKPIKKSLCNVKNLTECILYFTEDDRNVNSIFIVADSRPYVLSSLNKENITKFHISVLFKPLLYIFIYLGIMFNRCVRNLFQIEIPFFKLFKNETYSIRKLQNYGYSPKYTFHDY